LLICAIFVASAAPCADARVAQRAHGATHTRYAADLAKRVVPATGDGAPLVLVSAAAADASHRRDGFSGAVAPSALPEPSTARTELGARRQERR
jgi:hypothetical protein